MVCADDATANSAQLAWEVWYRDTFDRECPSKCEARGVGLVDGLIELWARYLFESVQENGNEGFSSFYMFAGPKRIDIRGAWEGAKRLRSFVFGSQSGCRGGYVAAANQQNLRTVAAAHTRLIESGQTSEPILAAALDTKSEPELAAALSRLGRS